MPETLNEAQLKAVRWKGGPLMVLAGPGTGKTRVIAHRVLHLVEQGSAPESIVAVTYTVKAAEQLRERLAESLGPDRADRVSVHTFHGLGMRLLRRFGDVLGLPASPDLIDSAQAKRMLRELVDEHGLFRESIAEGRDAAIERAVGVMTELDDHAVDPADARRRAEEWIMRARFAPGEEAQAELARAERFRSQAALFDLYDKARRARGQLSYGDLIALPIRILSGHGPQAALCRGEFKHFIVDEFQDSNPAQLKLLAGLAPAKNADVCVVGDDDQSIYAFRGADDRAFEHFKRRWPAAATIPLRDNYRSAPQVVAATNRIISLAGRRFAPDKEIVAADAAAAGSVECIPHGETFDDGGIIAAAIHSDRRVNPDRPFSAYAVIAKTHSDLDRIAGALDLEGIPARRQRTRSPLDDEGVQDVMSWAELLAEEDHSWCALRILRRPPFSMDPSVVAAWERMYRADRRAAPSPPGGFVAWLLDRRGNGGSRDRPAPPGLDDPRLGRFLERHAELKGIAGASSAEETITRIVTLTDPAHADLPADAGGVARARRIADLVALIRFARARQRRLPPPGDLRAFLEYFGDLDERERGLAAPGDERLDAAAESFEGDETDGVTLLTAHSAKGLEFDTVFVVRISPQHGFGASRKEDQAPLPPEILGRGAEESTLESEGEQRRLFYVACTRAQRRLILLSKGNKTRSKSTHFFEEFTKDPAGLRLVNVRSPESVFDEANRRGVTLRFPAKADPAGLPPEGFRDILARYRSRARQAASLALESADRPDLTAEQLEEAAARLREAAGRLALAAAAQRGVQPPPWAETLPEWRDAAAALAAGRPTLAPGFTFRAPGPRLELNYSSISDYLACPRCWYVKHMMGVSGPGSDRLNLGVIVHRVLQVFTSRHRDAEAEGRLPPGERELAALCRQEASLEAGVFRAVENSELDQILALARTAVSQLEEDDANVIEIEKELRFAYPRAGVRHTISVRIDRVDQLRDNRFRIVDYKTGAARRGLLKPEKDDLQMGLYTLALAGVYGTLEGELPTPPAGQAEYWVLATGQRGIVPFDGIDFGKVRAKIDGVIDDLLAGRFPKKPASCRGLCDLLGDPHETVRKSRKEQDDGG